MWRKGGEGQKAQTHSFAIMQRRKITAFPYSAMERVIFTNNTNLEVLKKKEEKERGKRSKTKLKTIFGAFLQLIVLLFKAEDKTNYDRLYSQQTWILLKYFNSLFEAFQEMWTWNAISEHRSKQDQQCMTLLTLSETLCTNMFKVTFMSLPPCVRPSWILLSWNWCQSDRRCPLKMPYGGEYQHVLGNTKQRYFLKI